MFPSEPIFSIRETATCPSCCLHQYATLSGDSVACTKCRRCGQPLGIAFYRLQTTRICEEGGLPGRNSIQQLLGAFIRSLRLKRHISQEELSHRLEIHRTVVTRMEGGHFLNLSILFRAAHALDLEIDEIFVRVRDRRSRKQLDVRFPTTTADFPLSHVRNQEHYIGNVRSPNHTFGEIIRNGSANSKCRSRKDKLNGSKG